MNGKPNGAAGLAPRLGKAKFGAAAGPTQQSVTLTKSARKTCLQKPPAPAE